MSKSYAPQKPSGVSPAQWRYGMPAIVLHWALALLIIFMAGLGWYMMTVEHEPGGEWYIDLHKSVGLIVLTLVALRVLWRMAHRPEPLPAGLPHWQIALSRWTEGLLYLCMLVMPITGLLGSIYSKAGLAFFGVALPVGVTPARDMSKLFFNIHSFTIWILTGLVVLHALGGLKHLLVDKDRVFQRMWFR